MLKNALLSSTAMTSPGTYRYGTSKSDWIYGDDNIDVIYGYGGADTIYSFGGDDIVYGGGGDDKIVAGDGYVFLSGGDGYDQIVAGIGGGTINGGAGGDNIWAGFNEATGSYVDEYGNVVYYTYLGAKFGSAPFIINAGSGDDLVVSSDGSDTISAGSGNDAVYADLSTYDGGNDFIYLGLGHDFGWGGGGDDRMFGGDGNDTLNGGGGSDVLNGGTGNNVFWASGGDILKLHEFSQNTILLDWTDDGSVRIAGGTTGNIEKFDFSHLDPTVNEDGGIGIWRSGMTSLGAGKVGVQHEGRSWILSGVPDCNSEADIDRNIGAGEFKLYQYDSAKGIASGPYLY